MTTNTEQLLRKRFEAAWRKKYDNRLYCESAWEGYQMAALTQPAQAGEIAAWAQDEQFALAISDGAHIATTVTIYKDRQPRFANTALYTTPPASQEQATDATILRYFAPWLPHPANDDDKQDLIKSARACFAKAPCGCRVGECESKADAHCRMTDEVHHQASQEPSGGEVWIQPDHLQKARVAPFLCRVSPTQDAPDFVPLTLATPKPEPTTWQPIATAPKDGTMFLGWVAAERWSSPDGQSSSYAHDTSQVDFCWWRAAPPDPSPEAIVGGHFDNASGQIGDGQDITHWMPLPPAPITKGEA